MRSIASLAAGLLFGAGLFVSGLVDPRKVLAFLDIAGNFDPSLAFTMGGAVITTALGYRLVMGRDKPLFEHAFAAPSAGPVDARLLAGAGLFGAGWGLAGYCPGPALAAVGSGAPLAVLFLVAMLAGMQLGRIFSAQGLHASGTED